MYGALHEVSPHWPLPARLPQGRDLGSPATHDRTAHSPNLCARQTRIPSHLFSPGLFGKLKQRQQGVSILASQTSWTKVSCCNPRTAAIPKVVVAPNTLAGCIPPRLATPKAPVHHDLPVQITSLFQDSDESIIQPGGWKRPRPHQHVRDRGGKVTPVTSTSPGTSETRSLTNPLHAPTNWGGRGEGRGTARLFG